MKLIVGLGNIGKEYINTRHNVGFMVVDNYVKEETWKEQFNGLITTLTINEEKVLFLKPTTFMNASGIAVQKVVDYYDIALEDILIIHDDLDIPLGKYKLKTNSSSGGHNGIKSIISALNSENFSRLKVGISKSDEEVIDYVLGKFSKEEKKKLESNFPIFNEIIEYFVSNGIDKTMAKYN